MKTSRTLLLATALAFAAPLALAKAPSGATGHCKDGSYTRDTNRATACEGHRGLKTWYGKKKAAKASSSSSTQAEPGSTTALRPDKPAQDMGDRKNNTQPTDSPKR
jgi:hypothetical protein